MKVVNIVTTIIFAIIIALPLLSSVIPLLPQNQNTENRTLKTSPSIPESITAIQSYPKEFESFFNDQFEGRSLLFDLNMTIKSKLSSKPFKDNSLLIGKDGWYFSNFQKVVDDYRAVRPFTSIEINSIVNQLLDAKNELNERGIKYYLLVVPNKHTIYNDKLPEYVRKIGEKSRFEQLVPAFESADLNFVDIRKEMLKAKSEKDLYFKTDSHWNLHGSYIGYKKLFDVISRDFPQIIPNRLDQFNVSQRNKKGGDIVAMMGKENEIQDVFIEYRSKNKVNVKEAPLGEYALPQPKIFHPEISVSAFESNSSSLTAVIFKDSYAGYMQQFINPHFKRTTYVWGHDYYLNKEIINYERPDIVIQVIVERYLYSLLRAADVNDK